MKKKPTSKKPRPPQNFSIDSIKTFLNREVIGEVFHSLNRIWSSLKLNSNIEGEYATDDPALTGIIAAFIAAINGSSYNLRLYPNFENTTLNITGEIQGRLIPAIVIWDFGNLMLKPPIRKIWRNMYGRKIKEAVLTRHLGTTIIPGSFVCVEAVE